VGRCRWRAFQGDAREVLRRLPAGSAQTYDAFLGAATTGLVAARHNRRCIGIELNRQYLRRGLERMAAGTGGSSAGLRAAG
jgi:hypothetical protein